MKNLLLWLVVYLLPSVCLFAQTSIQPKDIAPLIGKWEGSLTYLDYTSQKPYTMPANIHFEVANDKNKLICKNIYPDEPKANSTDTLVLSNDGKQLDKKPIKSKKVLADGAIEIITEYLGKDGNEQKSALIRLTYTFNDKYFSKRKDIRFVGQTAWIQRHEYKYKRK
ncbi:MAG: hypothetical protein ACOVQA_13875 [Thermoflexibacteraceae bacterium]